MYNVQSIGNICLLLNYSAHFISNDDYYYICTAATAIARYRYATIFIFFIILINFMLIVVVHAMHMHNGSFCRFISMSDLTLK